MYHYSDNKHVFFRVDTLLKARLGASAHARASALYVLLQTLAAADYSLFFEWTFQLERFDLGETPRPQKPSKKPVSDVS